MSNVFSITEIISKEFLESPTGTITSILGILGTILTVFIFIKKMLNAPIKGKSNFLQNAGIPNWIMRIFLIKIPLNQVPKNSTFDKSAYSFIIVILFCSVLYTLFMHIQTIRTPENWTLLVHKPTGESFYLNGQYAKGTSFFPQKQWFLTIEQCKQSSPEQPIQQSGLSSELADFLCQLLSHKDAPQFIADAIEKFKTDRKTINYLLTPFETIFTWLAISIALTWYFKEKLRVYINKENDKAKEYLT